MENSYIIVNGFRLDTMEGQPIPITRTIADIMEPATRKKSQTKTFVLPGTQRNLKFFQSAFALSWRVQEGTPVGVNYDVSALYTAEYYERGRLAFRGALQLLTVTNDKGVFSFEVVLFSQIISVFQQWQELKISDLDWSEYDHTLNETNIQNSWDTSVIQNGVPVSNFTGTQPDGFGYLYGLVDYGFNNWLDIYKDSDIFPMVYFKEIIEKAFDFLGYTVDNTFIGTDQFKRFVLGYGGGDKLQLTTAQLAELEYNLTADGGPVQFGSGPNPIAFDDGYGIYNQAWFNFQTENLQYNILTIPNDPSGQVTNGKITVPKTGTYRIQVQFDMDYEIGFPKNFVSTNADINYRFDLRFYNNFWYQTRATETGAAFIDELNPETGTWSVNRTFDVFLESGDEYFIGLSMLTTGDFDFTTGDIFQGAYIEVDFNSTIAISQECINSEIKNGDTVYLASVLPNIKVVDFMKGVIEHFGLNISEPDADGVVFIEPRVDFFTSNDDNDDWTEKLDLDKPYEVEPIAINQPKQYKWQFKQDNDYYRKVYKDLYGMGYGDYTYENPSFFAKGEQVYELPYTITPPVQRANSNLIVPRVIEVNNGVVKPFKGSPRAYLYQGTDNEAWTMLNSDTNAEMAQTKYPMMHHLDDTSAPTFDMLFGTPQQVFYTAPDYTTTNCYSEYLELFIREITSIDSKLFRGHFYLSENDAEETTLPRVKLIDGVLYRLNQIRDYVNNESTLVELTKILDIRKRKNYDIAIGINSKESIGQFNTYNSTDTEYSSKTQDYTAGVTVSMANNLYNIDTTSGEITVTLDHRELRDNFRFNIRKSAGGSDVIIICANGKTLNGETTQRISGVYNSFWIKWDGTEFTVN